MWRRRWRPVWTDRLIWLAFQACLSFHFLFTGRMMETILRTIPHRPPFLFIDEILEVRPDGVVCQRTIRKEEPQFQGHYPGNPIMPGVLLCEACFQAGAIYLARQMEASGTSLKEVTPVLARICDARFKQMVKPGDALTIDVAMKETVSKFHFMKGKVLKSGKPALVIEFALAMLEPEGSR